VAIHLPSGQLKTGSAILAKNTASGRLNPDGRALVRTPATSVVIDRMGLAG
jgi:hypothetical protein